MSQTFAQLINGKSATVEFSTGSASTPSVAFSGDTNTGIFSPGADQVAISTNGVGRLSVSSTGDLTLGTSTAGGTFYVLSNSGGYNGPAIVGQPGGASAWQVGTSANFAGDGSTDLALQAGTSKNIRFYTNGSSERLRITSAGNVGIGTTSPGTTLHCSSSSVDIATFQRSSAGADAALMIVDGNSTGAYINTAGGANVVFATRSAGTNAERARIDSSGRLLVGTSSSGSIARLSVQGSTIFNDAFFDLCYNGSAASTIAANTVLGSIRFTDQASNANQFATIKCETDAAVSSASDLPGRLVFSTTADGASTPTERWRIDSFGSLIGVAGSAIVAPYVYNQTTATAANVNVNTTGFLLRSTSSIKYKTNVETIEDQYADAILGCRPVWYQSTCDADKPEWGHWGFIAEEVAAIDPRLCFFKEEEDGTLEPEGVQYDRFVPHLLNLIKRQGEAIADLQAEVAALKTK